MSYENTPYSGAMISITTKVYFEVYWYWFF